MWVQCWHPQEYFKKLGLPDEVAELLARKGTYDNFPLEAEAVTAVRVVSVVTPGARLDSALEIPQGSYSWVPHLWRAS